MHTCRLRLELTGPSLWSRTWIKPPQITWADFSLFLWIPFPFLYSLGREITMERYLWNIGARGIGESFLSRKTFFLIPSQMTSEVYSIPANIILVINLCEKQHKSNWNLSASVCNHFWVVKEEGQKPEQNVCKLQSPSFFALLNDSCRIWSSKWIFYHKILQDVCLQRVIALKPHI